MDDKHDQTQAMLNDEHRPNRSRIDDNRTAASKVLIIVLFLIEFRRRKIELNKRIHSYF